MTHLKLIVARPDILKVSTSDLGINVILFVQLIGEMTAYFVGKPSMAEVLAMPGFSEMH
jgi:hypothetical protein